MTLISPPLPRVDEREPVILEEVRDRYGRLLMVRLVGTVSGAAMMWAR